MLTERRPGVSEAFKKGVAALKGAGIGSPALDASILLGHVTGRGPGEVLLDRGRCLTAEEEARFEELIERRCGRETVSRLLGSKEFYSLVFRTGPDVLDPRPETELLVEKALEFLRKARAPRKVLEVGTGSGAVAVTIALLDPAASVVATDICPKALEVAGANARDHGVRGRVRLVRADMVSGFFPGAGFDLVVSNPPYIAEGQFPALPAEVRLGDPYRALVAGPEGTEFYGPLANGAAGLLRPGGMILVEVGAGQSGRVEGLFRERGFRDVGTFQDLAGMGRVVKGEKQDA